MRGRRFLREAEGHLRDAAARHRVRGLSSQEAERTAIEDFGSTEVVARRLAAEAARGETRGAACLALVASAFFVVPLYVISENTLPPAQWATKPRDVLVLQVATVTLWLVAVVLAGAGAVLSWTPWSRFAAASLMAAVGAIAGSVLVSAALVERWFAAAPATPSWPLLAAPAAVGCLAVCIAASLWARSRSHALGDALVQD